MSDDLTALGDFHGRARLFPLPNLVLFPCVIQPLHVFEERYRQLMDDALKGDRLIGMALLRPGWEKEQHKIPPIYPVICLGKIHKEERLPDGRWNLLLHGLARARVENELKVDRLYRVAKARLVQEEEVASVHTARDLRRRLGLGMEALVLRAGGRPGPAGEAAAQRPDAGGAVRRVQLRLADRGGSETEAAGGRRRGAARPPADRAFRRPRPVGVGRGAAGAQVPAGFQCELTAV